MSISSWFLQRRRTHAAVVTAQRITHEPRRHRERGIVFLCSSVARTLSAREFVGVDDGIDGEDAIAVRRNRQRRRQPAAVDDAQTHLAVDLGTFEPGSSSHLLSANRK